jgi:hypothetical protein
MLTGVMWLHSLERVTQHAAALDVDLSLLGDDGSLDAASRPEVVVHGAPRCLGVGAVVGCTVLSTHEAGSSPGELDIDHTVVVHRRLDGVCAAIFRELDGDAVGVEGMLLLVESVVGDGITGPEEGLLIVRVEKLAVELHGHSQTSASCEYYGQLAIEVAYSRDVVVDDLQEARVSSLGEEVEGLRLDVGVVERHPLEVLLGQLGIGGLTSLLAHGLDGIGAVFGLLGAGNRG